jgi:phosphohistidine phosphatase
MKTLLFFRHAKSDWNAAFGHDHERPINKRGRRDARIMGRFLSEIGDLPDRIVTSSAVRACSTLELAMDEGEWGDIPVEKTDRLYEASEDDVLHVIREQPDACDCLMLVGHEPTWSSMLGRLSGKANVRVSTATMARIDFDVPSWKAVAFGRGQFCWLVPPKLHR